ncbi:MAG: NADH-quinone oxidoreductase subunit J [Steroidobacteraceae bacterium]
MFVQLLFYTFSLVLLATASGVILLRNPVHSALCLVLTFFTSAAIWLLIEAEFLAIVLVLVYVGAVMVLFLFVVMMLDVDIEELRAGFTKYAWIGGITALVLVLEIVGVVATRGLSPAIELKAGIAPSDPALSNTSELGAVLYTKYVYPFELAAMLLLVAIIAAIVLTMRHRQGLKVQDVAKQVATRREDRVRVLKVEAEKRE